MPNTQYHPIFLLSSSFEKRRELWQQQKSLADIRCLVFSRQLMQRNRFNFPKSKDKEIYCYFMHYTIVNWPYCLDLHIHICTHFSEISPEFLWLCNRILFLPNMLHSQVENFQEVSFVLFLIYSSSLCQEKDRSDNFPLLPSII